MLSDNGELLEDCRKRLQEQLADDSSTCSDISEASVVDELDEFTLTRQLHNSKFEEGRDLARERCSQKMLRSYGAATQRRPREGEASDVVRAAVQRHHLHLAETNTCLDLAEQHRQSAAVLQRNGDGSQDVARI